MAERLLRGTVVTDGRTLPDTVVAITGDRIVSVGPAGAWDGPPGLLPPPSDRLLLPGLVDVHCHGAAGHGFPDASAEGVAAAVAHHREHGTTTMLASLVSAPAATLADRLELLGPLVGAGELAGIHLEGPFLAVARCGAHDPTAIVPGDPVLLEKLLATAGGTVVSMTLAPETPQYSQLLAVLAEYGALPSIGHTDADARSTAVAIERAGGAPISATHLFNAMPPVHHRAPGPVTACLAAAARGELIVELIADGVHLSPDTVSAVFDLVGPDRIALVTDAMAAAGMPDGRYRLGAMDVRVTDRVARLAAPDAATSGAARPIAGGTARMIDVLRSTVTQSRVPLATAVPAATRTPARLLGLGHEIGSLAPGYRADVLVTDAGLRPIQVLRRGASVAGRPERSSS
ncbi:MULTISPECIES: N-acetylglucosamine-6-phosphate deacetylase [Pseudonocardia]|uniref:N-acetylglucosamine-6-phosphate deacetylase n=2 Tax=Pseudonocardia TaxID=1847 RepID=A0A1Y2N2P9_PSEAH|nr:MULTISPECIES: N-acetylglucosamine-6-phosphate deacetylase [Pseudonocardia]OSY41178.1 N-acetylglucosamine-6-phosphate deacetylase [Pseudonocardia autotrophica]TDN76634.1 N-acetylglucosamine 6-phosphate deacetylase [Pseudonocardia autotrophica]BBG00634.1 N-acetylglucosamine-6-phosphate deacetylase [Pseudonocardia autotrophica]GEC28012.1 N-acetylglucosamine-6-phosphate deacetylase [Pseudonocardia saturnea]